MRAGRLRTGRLRTTVVETRHPRLNQDRLAIDLVMVDLVTIDLGVAVAVVIIARFRLHDPLVLPVNVRRIGANVMETAPENRVQQHRCDGDKSARGVHVGIPCGG